MTIAQVEYNDDISCLCKPNFRRNKTDLNLFLGAVGMLFNPHGICRQDVTIRALGMDHNIWYATVKIQMLF